ncbi:MAG: hypothetical protein M3O70_13470 [Actinomycetota bacterium]|nr:hypothetical protein [Actinomycetota bacterium]
MAGGVSVAELVEGHVALEIESLDRIYLNGYVPNLQVGRQVVHFLTEHLGNKVPSPAIFSHIGERFRAAVKRFAEDNDIQLLRFSSKDERRKIDLVRPLLERAERQGRFGVVAVGVAQEFQNVFTSYKRDKPTPSGLPQFSFVKADRKVNCYYFYIFDHDFGPCFIKITSYFPYPLKVWRNGHEWAKRQATKAAVDFTPLANGFAACSDPVRLQAICDGLGPNQILLLFERWMRVLPRPLTDRDRRGGYWWELSMRQIEVSRTLVFDVPRRARSFFEAVVRDNLGLGRPHEVELIFAGRDFRPGRKPKKAQTFKTKVVTRGVEVTLNVFYKHSPIKQYLKEGRALRIETVVNAPGDLGVRRRLCNLPQLQAKARQANRRILEVQHAGQGCAIGPTLFERIQQPYAREGQRTGALRFGDTRAIALAGALCLTLHAVTGFTNRSLRALVAGLLGVDYTTRQMTYDLRRLRLHGLIQRVNGRNLYLLTPDGLRFATFYNKLADRVVGPLFTDDHANAPPKLRRAPAVIDGCVDDYLQHAGLTMAE